MNLNQIKTFLTVAKTLSFTNAAQELFITQQAVSKYILNLEEELGCTLFERNYGSIRLTAAGRHYNEYFNYALDRGQKIRHEAKMNSQNLMRQMHLGYSVWINPFGELDTAIKAFRQDRTETRFLGWQFHKDELLRRLSTGQLHLAFMPATHIVTDDVFKQEPIAQEHICLCVPDDIQGDQIPPECWGLPLLQVTSWNWSNFPWKKISAQEQNRYQAQYGICPTEIRYQPNVQSVLAELGCVRCAALLDSRFGFANNVPNVRMIPLPVSRSAMLMCVWHKQCESPLVPQLVGFLQRYYGQTE